MPSFPSKLILAVAGIILLVFLVYTPALENDFVNWDDDVHLTRNQFIRSLDIKHIKDIFTTTVNKTYIPLTTLSFAVERHFFGVNPFVPHLNNVLLHIFVTVCVFMFSLHCGLSLFGATIAALIFGVHPMHVESVAWITERKDVLYASFFMLSLLSYCHYIKTGCEKRQYFLLTMVLGFLSVLAKPMALSLPIVLFILDWFYRRKVSAASLIEKGLVAAIMAPVVWVTYHANARVLELVFPRSLLLWIWNLTFYLKKFFYPDYFVVFYKIPHSIAISNASYVYPIVFLCVLIILMVLFRKNRLFLFGVLFYFVSIFFLLKWDTVADANIVADRFMYLPSLGVCLWIGFLCQNIIFRQERPQSYRIIAVCLGVLVLATLSWKTFKQCYVWRNGVALWGHQVEKQPLAATALVYTKLGQATVMRDDFQDIINRHKAYHNAVDKTGIPALSSNDIEEINRIIRLYRRAILIKPDYSQAHFNLGNLYADLGDIGRAEYYYNKAIEFFPENFAAYFEMGRLNQRMGNHKKAIEWFREALNLSPDNQLLLERTINILEHGRKKSMDFKALYIEERRKKALDVKALYVEEKRRVEAVYKEQFE